MKTQSRKELLTLLGALLGTLLLGIALLVIWLYQWSDTVSLGFASGAHYLQLFLRDEAFLTALRNTLLLALVPLFTAVLAAKGLSMLLAKRKKYVGILSLALMLGLLVVSFFVLILPVWSGDSLAVLTRLHIISAKELFKPEGYQKAAWFIGIAMFVIALSCCYSMFYLAERLSLTGFYKLLLNFAGILAAQFWISSLPDALSALVGVPVSSYAGHTIVAHISDAPTATAFSTLSISVLFFRFSAVCLLVLLVWAADRWRQARAEKKQA